MKPELSPELKGKYEVVGVVPGVIFLPGKGEIDLRTCTLEQADEFVKDERFVYLKPIQKPK